jgi:hypothetical protein
MAYGHLRMTVVLLSIDGMNVVLLSIDALMGARDGRVTLVTVVDG